MEGNESSDPNNYKILKTKILRITILFCSPWETMSPKIQKKRFFEKLKKKWSFKCKTNSIQQLLNKLFSILEDKQDL
jgi:hypothetical protein